MPGQVRLEIVGPDQVLDVEEGCSLEPHVDERGLHPGQYAADLAEVDVSERPLGALPLEMQLSDDPIFDQRDACLADVHIDDEKVLSHVGCRTSAAPPSVTTGCPGHEGATRSALRD